MSAAAPRRSTSLERCALALAALACPGLGAAPVPGQGQVEAAVHRQFLVSDRCIACHSGLRAPSGEDVSIGYDWRSSIMANAARDPYWQASVRREVLDRPAAAAKVENDCSICHMPMPTTALRTLGSSGEIFRFLPLDARGELHAYAADGVSCTVCHQMTAEGFGRPESFNGGFHIEAPTAAGIRPEYGPFDVSGGRMDVMSSSTEGLQPNRGDHVRASQLCATCHTLYTGALDARGRQIGSLPEQMPYLEWLHSDFRDQASCQSCHMPEVTGPVPIVRVLAVPRERLARHVFVGANFLMQDILGAHASELAVRAPPAQLAAAAEHTRQYLQAEAARVQIESLELAHGELTASVTVENRGGHKLPSAYPARRAWLHVSARDAAGRIVFESGRPNPDGSIAGNPNDVDPLRFEAHHAEITSADQVQIYEPILGDAAGRPTTGLLAAVRYLKDNRLLPRGFDKATAPQDIAVVGEAAADPQFHGGGHRIRYRMAVGETGGPYEVEAELWYEPIGFRWAHNLEAYASAPTARMVHYYDTAGAHAVRLAADRARR